MEGCAVVSRARYDWGNVHAANFGVLGPILVHAVVLVVFSVTGLVPFVPIFTVLNFDGMQPTVVEDLTRESFAYG